MAGDLLDITGWTCPMPLRDYPTIVTGHGGGGAMSAELVEHLFLPALGGAVPGGLVPGGETPDVGSTTGEAAGTAPAGTTDSAVVEIGGARLALSTDSHVVRPLFFPGGSIGDLAVNGTVNDVAMSGARPLYLTAGFILEEGTDVDVVGRIAQEMGRAAERAGVRVVAGDTKVVGTGHGDGVYVTTAGVGLVPPGVDIRPQRARPGDAVLLSGPIGLHGVAVLSVREGLEFGTEVRSDSAPLNGLVEAMLAVTTDLHVLRDPTRGGLAAALNEIATAAGVGVRLEERAVPVPSDVANACGILGLDPMYVANEGKLVAIVDPAHADAVLEAMRAHPLGSGAVRIGEVVDEHPGMVVATTGLGGTRVVDLPLGEQLPRIC